MQGLAGYGLLNVPLLSALRKRKQNEKGKLICPPGLFKQKS